MAMWEIQRQITGWESIKVEAETFEDAITEAEENWQGFYILTETFEPTGTHWGMNLETEEEFINN